MFVLHSIGNRCQDKMIADVWDLWVLKIVSHMLIDLWHIDINIYASEYVCTDVFYFNADTPFSSNFECFIKLKCIQLIHIYIFLPMWHNLFKFLLVSSGQSLVLFLKQLYFHTLHIVYIYQYTEWKCVQLSLNFKASICFALRLLFDGCSKSECALRVSVLYVLPVHSLKVISRQWMTRSSDQPASTIKLSIKIICLIIADKK